MREHDGFRWPGEHVDGTIEGDEFLRGSHVRVAGTDNLLHPRNDGIVALPAHAISKCCDRLRAADSKEVLHAQQRSSCKSLRRGLRRSDLDMRNACDLRR